jgi:UDP-N-acetylmuramate dehydrogenase
MLIQENIPLAPLTTLGVGGPARYFAEAATAGQVREAVAWAAAAPLPLFVLGGGSNLLAADAGFPGLVLKTGILGVTEQPGGQKLLFTAGAAEDWDTFVSYAVVRNCAGVECLSGIPGTVGAAPVQNVGAYGQEVSETIFRIEVLDTVTGETEWLDKPHCEFGYRSSIFNGRERGRYIILRVTFALTPGGPARIAYADLKRHFGSRVPSLAETTEAVRRIRLDKGMLLVKGAEDCRSAGSFFKNPVLNPDEYAEVERRAYELGLSIPCYPVLASQYKIPAGWLVEQSGFHKGYRRGPAGISPKHALALVNYGGATAADLLALKDQIQAAVYARFGIALQPEPVFVGFTGEGTGQSSD